MNRKSEQLANAYESLIAALCIWREARGEPIEGKTAIWHVLKNRLISGQWGKTMVAVVTSPWQFSSFNSGDPNSIKFPNPNDPTWQECLDVVSSSGPDITHGAMFYFNPNVVRPAWAAKMDLMASFGNHDFYKDRRPGA